MPKQFIVLKGRHSPFQETMLRVRDETVYGRPVVVAAEAQRFLIERQLAEIGMTATILLEPMPRDSGPAVLAGCLLIASEGERCTVAVLASDHLIEDTQAFHASLKLAEAAALGGAIVTFGMTPTLPATGFGYIQPGGPAVNGVRPVRRFAEKPNVETAERYIAEGYFWNSGNLLTRPETLIAEYKRLQPAGFEAVRRAFADRQQIGGSVLLGTEAYATADRTSIDYAVMEATPHAAVVPAAWGWSDIGTWQALWETGDRDESGNVRIGETESLDSHDCYIRSRGQLISVVGARDLIVIVEPDAVLVAHRGSAPDVKRLVDTLQRKSVPQATSHARVHRPWGWYEMRDRGEMFQVKQVAVYPGGRLSLQKHRFRAEHWVIVAGIARVTVGDKVCILGANDHAEIPLGAIHRLENAGSELLEIVEVQHGTYLGEDDTVHIEDIEDIDDRVLDAAQ
jgi:mannose-1-phosphate guanylyltransferase/mannose-6-phosphate isomerase